jgi:hypothetical protein
MLGLLLVAGCGGSSTSAGPEISVGPSPTAPGSPSPGPGQRPGQEGPPRCTATVSQAQQVAAALNSASPGSTVCFTGSDLSGSDVQLSRSGNANAPITLLSQGATVGSVHISGDHVVVDGFTVRGGQGLFLRGQDLTVRHNTVQDTQEGGINCSPCSNSDIDSNTVRHAATFGIWISGQKITVTRNTISNTVARNNGDADGMRFFGSGHQITQNNISDISAEGYPNPPHPDCFQTYDGNGPPTYGVLIAGNTCRNVDAQCLIATGDKDSNGDAPTNQPSITFVDNTCASNGAQAINLRRWPNVEIRNNHISGPNITRGIIIIDGSTGCVVVGNTTADGKPTVDIDGSSRSDAQVEHNSPS